MCVFTSRMYISQLKKCVCEKAARKSNGCKGLRNHYINNNTILPFSSSVCVCADKFFSDSTAFLFACKEDDNSINLSLLFYGNCASNYPSGFCMVVLVRVHITKQLEPTFLCYLGALVP